MSTFLQFALPFAVSLLVLGIFHLVAYLHIQLSEAETADADDEAPVW